MSKDIQRRVYEFFATCILCSALAVAIYWRITWLVVIYMVVWSVLSALDFFHALFSSDATIFEFAGHYAPGRVIYFIFDGLCDGACGALALYTNDYGTAGWIFLCLVVQTTSRSIRLFRLADAKEKYEWVEEVEE